MPEWIVVIVLGVIEGITEFLPISSTGHLLIAQHWLPAQSELFDVVIQCGAVVAVLMVFSKRVLQLLTDLQNPDTRDYLFKLVVAFGITGCGGLALKATGFTLPGELAPIAWTTLIGGGLILAIEFSIRGKPTTESVTWPMAIAVAVAQLIAAAYPGTSRSGATIMVALLLGLSRTKATEFSFLLGIPTMFAAGAYSFHHGLKHAPAGSIHWSMLLLGSAVAAATAFIVVKWLLHYVQTHNFNAFGWYRIVLGMALLAWTYSR